MRPSPRPFAFVAVLAIIAGTIMSPAAAGSAVTKPWVKQFVKKRIASVAASVAVIEGRTSTLETSVAGIDGRTSTLEASLTAHKVSGDHDGRYWKLGGNGGTADTAFLGTTDDHPLVLTANGESALRLDGATIGASVIPNLVGGWSGNEAGPDTVGVAIGGGGCPSAACGVSRPNVVTANHGTIAGGDTNTASGANASVGGGRGNTAGPGLSATVGGGESNEASGSEATVGGGLINTASGSQATVGGGASNTASESRATVGGGEFNTASASKATVGGGEFNMASGAWATVGGGGSNMASGFRATVGGGGINMASGSRATVGGGDSNSASGAWATVGGGESNDASGQRATVPGGRSNSALGDGSFAAGFRASVQAGHHGTFVWADQTDVNFLSEGPNEFAVRSTGGARFVSAVDGFGNPTAGVELAAGGGSWSSLSDRAAKKGFVPVDPAEVLQRVAGLPIATWSYKTQADGIRHIGPVAQDFHAAFGVGENDTSITAVDADGVALAAIQGLNEKLENRIADLESRLAGSERSGSFPLSGIVWALAALALGLGIGIGGAAGRRLVPAA